MKWKLIWMRLKSEIEKVNGNAIRLNRAANESKWIWIFLLRVHELLSESSNESFVTVCRFNFKKLIAIENKEIAKNVAMFGIFSRNFFL